MKETITPGVEALRLVEAISENASDIRADWSDPRTELRNIQDCCDSLRKLLSVSSEITASEPAIQAVLKEMAWGQDCRDDAIQLLRAIQNAAPQVPVSASLGNDAEVDSPGPRSGLESATSASTNPAGAASSHDKKEKVRRYREVASTFGGGRMVEKDTGEWVAYDDYSQLERELAILKASNEGMFQRLAVDSSRPQEQK